MNPNKQLGGLKAKHAGATFEKIFKTAASRERVHCERMPDGCRRVSKFKLIQVRTPFDYIIASYGRVAFIDVKTFEHEHLRHSDIKEHQLESLYNLGWHAPSGYVVWFRKSNSVVFYPWNLMVKIFKKQSALPEAGRLLGKINDFSVKQIFRSYQPETYGDQLAADFAFWKG